MEKSKKYALVGVLSPIVFIITYIIMTIIRPDYNHLTKAVSELGSLDAPNKWWWNIIGYILVGSMVSYFSIGLRKSVNPDGKGKIAFIELFLSGFFLAFSGIFPGDFNDRISVYMILHSVGALGSFIFFLVAAFSYPKQFNKTSYWKKTTIFSLIITILCISSFFIQGDTPGLGQRIGFLFYFFWIAYLAFKLLKFNSSSEVINKF